MVEINVAYATEHVAVFAEADSALVFSYLLVQHSRPRANGAAYSLMHLRALCLVPTALA